MLEKKPTQCEMILQAFRETNGYLSTLDLNRLYIMQPHARMFELERQGYKFDKRKANGHNYMEYKLIEEPIQTKIF